ncbi:hypothetical protein LY78DRAFT_657362 [Colletotrichum sublineola]|nr:hypothetical protein LY78DRAFT_657362 [Colletotrichum sublineola]
MEYRYKDKMLSREVARCFFYGLNTHTRPKDTHGWYLRSINLAGETDLTVTFYH